MGSVTPAKTEVAITGTTHLIALVNKIIAFNNNDVFCSVMIITKMASVMKEEC